MAFNEDLVVRVERFIAVAEYAFRRSRIRIADCIFANIPTSSKVLEVRMHVSRNPEERSLPSVSEVVELNSVPPDNRSYTANGGKSSAVHPDMDEYDADANI
jgi:hypothetical protein